MGVSIDHGAAAGGDDISIHQEKTSVAERAAISVQDGHPVEKEETSVQTGHTLDKDDDVSAQKEKDSEKQIDSPVPKEDTSGNKTNTIVERKCANVEEGIYSEEEAALIEKEAPAVDRNDALEQKQEHIVVKEETLTVTRTKRPRANRAEPSKSAVEIAAQVQDPTIG